MRLWGSDLRTGCAALALAGLLLLAGCGDGDTGPSRAEVEEIVRAELADAATPAPGPEPELTPEQIQEIVRQVVTAIPTPGSELTPEQIQEIVGTELADAGAALGPELTPQQIEDIVRQVVAAIPTSEPELTPQQIEEIVRTELADAATPEPGPGSELTPEQIQEIVRAELADAATPMPGPGLTAADAERIARGAVASVPLRSSPAEYTRFFVDNAVIHYETHGLDATLARYNSPQSIDGQWYVFIIDENDLVIAHPDPERRGLDLKGWVGTDANGYEFGPEMLSATEDGKWVSYVYRNPASGAIGSDFGELELKNVWVQRRDGLLFASGWYIDADTFTKQLVSIAVDRFRDGGLEETVAYFASPGSALAGLEAAVAYYNTAETVDGNWFAFIADPNGEIVAHSDPSMIGSDAHELFGGETLEADRDGDWVESESQRVWVAGHDGFVFGSGWHRGATDTTDN